jgi:hypothetical protein
LGNLAPVAGNDVDQTKLFVDLAVAAIVETLSRKAAVTGGAEEIFRTVKDQDGGVLDRLETLTGDGSGARAFQTSGEEILKLIFSDGQNETAKQVFKAQYDKVLRPNELLAKIAPIVIAVVGRHVKNKSLNVAGMASLLAQQKDYVGKCIPDATSDKQLPRTIKDQPDAAVIAASETDLSVNSQKPAVEKGSLSTSVIVILLLVLGLITIGIVWKFGIATTPAPNPKSEKPVSVSKPVETPVDRVTG